MPAAAVAAPKAAPPALRSTPASARSATAVSKAASPAAARASGLPSFARVTGTPAPRPKQLPASRLGSGQPLAPHIQEAIENSFEVDLSSVRLHTDARAQESAQQISARAFTHGSDIFLGPGEHPSDLSLIAHEAAHVVQQQSGQAQQRLSEDRGDRYEAEADRASAAVQRGDSFTVQERVGAGRVQRSAVSRALDWIADKANIIPGFRMFTIVLGVNPINMSHVDASAANVLRAVLEMVPGGGLVTQALESTGIFDKVGNWVAQKIKTLGMIGGAIKQALLDFIDSLGLSDVFHLGRVWDRAKLIFTEPIDRIINFVTGLVSDIIKFIKDAILQPLAKLAENTKAYPLLKAVLGHDPITGEPVPDDASAILGGLMTLAGQEEIWENIKKANAMARLAAWFKGAKAGLIAFVRQVPGLVISTIKSLELSDIILLPRAITKVVKVFGGFVVDFISWVGQAVWTLLEIVFDVVSPGAWSYIKKTGAALKSILKNPLPFVRNLVRAAKLGFENFVANILTHLKAGLIDWLTGSLTGVYIPKALTLGELGHFAMSVLGITWAQIRAKIVKALGANGEIIMQGLETAFDIVVALVKGGVAAAWDLIKEKLTNLKDMVIDGIQSFVIDTIVKKAIPKLIAMFIPGAGFISAIISIYDTIKVFIDKLAKMIAVVKSFVDSIVAIAAGQIEGAAKRVEGALAGILSLAISFLAGFLGLGNISSKIMGVIEKVRATVDKALDSAVEWIVSKARSLFKAAKSGVKSLLQWWTKKVPVTGDTEPHTLQFDGEDTNAILVIRTSPKKVPEFIEEKFVTDFVTAPGKATAAQKKKALDLDARIDTKKKAIIAAEAKSPPDTAAIDRLRGELDPLLDELGALLQKMFDDQASEGSEGSPLVVDYPKRRASAYPEIWVGKESSKRVKQEDLRNKPGATVYRPTTPKALPNGKMVGLSPQFASLGPGKLLKYDEKEGTGGGHKINDLFYDYGYRAKEEGMDGDHVLERQLGGPDLIENLWPLDKSENRSSGSLVKELPVKYKGKDTTVHKARESRSKGSPLYLLIRSVRG